MKLRFRNLIGVLVVAAAGFPFAAIAQSVLSTQISSEETVSDEFDRAFFTNDPEFFRNRSFGRQLGLIWGFGFPENEIAQDAELVDDLYKAKFKQQAFSGPIIRTRDLPNPYRTSILTSPQFNVNSQMQRSELIFDSQPLRR